MSLTRDVAVLDAVFNRGAVRQDTSGGTRSRVQAVLADLLHPAAVLMLCGNWKYALIFFAVSCAVVMGKRRVPSSLNGVYVASGAVIMTALLLVFRETPFAISASSRIPFLSALMLAKRNLEFLGVSYCYLRVIYALASPRPWSLTSYARYYFFFPTFISGPIMSPEEFRQSPRTANGRLVDGVSRMLYGLLRISAAVLLLTVIPLATASSIATSAADWPFAVLWFGVFLSGVWLYLNFAGYCDVFIGLATLCGRTVPENFANPFAAANITAFWQRWHITLGNWLRTMIYNPLSRRAVAADAAWLGVAGIPLITMLLCGAWHALTQPFLLWGLLHGAGLAVHAVWLRFVIPMLPASMVSHPAYTAAAWLLTHTFIAVTWVFFLPVLPDVTLASRLPLIRALLVW